MPRKPKTTSLFNDNELDLFARQVEQALENFSKAEWLSAHSPLAAPYFLGQALTPTPLNADAQERGQVLQRILLQASEQIDGELQELLQVVYFKRNPQLDNVGLAMALHMAERTFYRTRVKAIQALAHALNQAILPPLRPEAPILRLLIGRKDALSRALAVLTVGHSLYISGPGGAGKTTLGAAIAQRWASLQDHRNQCSHTVGERSFFWYTLRSSFNDQLSSFFFALGYFLRGLGAGYTWRQLVADQGATNTERILGLLRYDLKSLYPACPLLCIDEMDTLQDEMSEHVQILHLIEELRGQCPTILIGQRVLIHTDEQIQITGIDHLELKNLLDHADVPPLADELNHRLWSYTRGNPALILLFASLVRNGDDVEAALQMLAKTPSVEALFRRIWRRLTADEQHLLMELAVFRYPVPQDAWQAQSKTLEQLRQRELVQFDGYGGVQLLSHLQTLAYEWIPAELRPPLHLRAADIREERSEYVEAMYHAIEGKQPARAIWLWFAHRNIEKEHGRGSVALNLLAQISANDLPDERDRTALRIARGELLQLAGKPEDSEQEISLVITPTQSVLHAYTRRLQGYAQEVQGRTEEALEKYRESLESLLGLHQLHEVVLHSRLSFLHLYRRHDMERARQEALLARAKAEAVLGDVEAMRGNYTRAHELYFSAMETIEQLGGDLVTLSRIYSYLGVLNIKQGNLDAALEYIEKAMDCDQKLGDKVAPLYDVLNLAEVHRLAGRYEEAYRQARNGLERAEQLNHSYLIAGLAAGVGEACYSLERWEEAEYYASYSLHQEEEFFRASALVIIGLIRHKQGQYTESIRLLTSALDHTIQIEDRYTEASILHFIGSVHGDNGFSDLAKVAFKRSLKIYTDLSLPKEINKLQEQLRLLGVSSGYM